MAKHNPFELTSEEKARFTAEIDADPDFDWPNGYGTLVRCDTPSLEALMEEIRATDWDDKKKRHFLWMAKRIMRHRLEAG